MKNKDKQVCCDLLMYITQNFYVSLCFSDTEVTVYPIQPAQTKDEIWLIHHHVPYTPDTLDEALRGIILYLEEWQSRPEVERYE